MHTESVKDYPTPPAVEAFEGRIHIRHKKKTLASSTQTLRVLETNHPPVYYIPPSDITMKFLEKNSHSSYCEFKGKATYYDFVHKGKRIRNVAWTYEQPSHKYQKIANHLAFYAGKLDACFVNDEQVKAQEGYFYGGWITSNVSGPIKGGKGTWGW